MQVIGNTLQQVKKYKHLWLFTSGGKTNKKIDTRLVKQTKYCVSFIVP